MFLEPLLRRNPALVDAALDLHARGLIPPGTFVIDLDTVEANARRLAEAASRSDLALYFMTKQVGRNPLFAERVARHIARAVAVDLGDAAALSDAGVALGHVGHLVQPHESALDGVIASEPEVVTVFSAEKAAALSAAAVRAGRVQAVLLRVVGEGDEFFPGQEGGIPLDEVAAVRAAVDALPGARFAGVTTYPAIEFTGDGFQPSANMRTLTEAVRILGGAEQVNAPGHTSLAVLPLLRDAGATHGEPGHALTGTTPLAAQRDVGEEPAICYLSEVSHRDGDRLSVFGSGFYARGHCRGGLLVHGDDRRLLAIDPLPADAIDYYRHLRSDGGPAAVGDAVVFAFRFQAFTSRALVATVEGLSAGTPRLAGIHDSNGRPAATPRLA